MSRSTENAEAREPKRARGKQRVTELLQAAVDVFAEKGFAAATMTEIAARAGAPIGSLYQFFPVKEALADTLVQNFVALLVADFEAIEARASQLDTATLVEQLFGVMRGHPQERAAVLPLVEERMDVRTRQRTLRHMARKHVGAILRVHLPVLSSDTAREMAIVVLSLIKASNVINDEDELAGKAAAMRELRALAVHFIEQRMREI